MAAQKERLDSAADSSVNKTGLKDPIVSSYHLVSERCAELSELEYALIMTSNAFNKWMVRCMTAAGEPDMGPLDVSLLHHVNHRDRQKKLADICFVLNVEDTHIVAYALKKLVKSGYVKSEKQGKELYFSTTEKGRELCVKYREIRETCLIGLQIETGISAKAIGENAQLLRAISALYDNAARTAASL
ncbi:transcriptional regulator [Buttiauxella warmboldiae]|uniref:Transcriptional regulator n=2 Tax=Buttiauxella warmboldiae TaxID=82993 RepID=A0A3N5DGQ8_9ENTR|nr:transcriptional regulator [Buttiauxella warmboldiae]